MKMKNRLAWAVASFLIFGALTVSIAAWQAPPAAGQREPQRRQRVSEEPARRQRVNPAGSLDNLQPEGEAVHELQMARLRPMRLTPILCRSICLRRRTFTKTRHCGPIRSIFAAMFPVFSPEVWADNRMGSNPPATAGWGDCSRDIPVSEIKSPYPYKTAKEHYEALLAAATKKGGPTVHTRQTLPDWDGFYTRNGNARTQWLWGNAQPSTMLSLLTPEYQQRMVQAAFHESVTNAPQWSASFCLPEGYLRFYTQYAVQQPLEIMMNPNQVQLLGGIADNFLFKVLIGRKHVQQVPQWYGETIGFWDGDTLISWTANIQGWTITHGLFEFSSKMETVEIYTPRKDANGAVTGLNVESIFYDPDAFVGPLHSTMTWNRTQKLDSPNLRHTFVECLSNVVNVNGKPGQLAPNDDRYIDYYNRPWAKNWEKNFEKGWDKPDTDIPAGILDIFK
jgi:hypothetical protein